jgi:hypothetical protein
MKRPVAILVLGSGLLSCTSSGLNPDSPNYQWALVKMELEPASVKNAGILPLFQKPTGQEFGLVPRAIGSLQTTEAGKVTVRVTLHEPVINYAGQADVIEYPLVSFFGTRSEDGTRLIQADAPSANVPLGRSTMMHVQDLGNGRLRVQGATGDRPLPYVYYFDPAPARPGLVFVPTLP